ncbi:Avirulence (Avh) protein [Phytophthora megakarya]|uniref:Avirulence (Avh) protein n=1 Tax=Phytophthora megakarya TaxID=4795 RepID=A0A225VW84_9STRA|nr:Avirulence (Avh) protein [Phytophthora megakarya]
MLTSYVRKKLGLENLKYGKLARHKNFDGFVSYVDWAESRELSKKAHNHVPTYSVWKDNGLDRVTNVDDLNAIRQTDAFRIYRRYVNILDNLELSTIKAGYGYLYPHKYIGEDGTKMERMARFQIMGEARRPEYYPKEILGLRWASEDQLKKNSNYINYLTTFHKTNEAVKVDNVALIRKNLLET